MLPATTQELAFWLGRVQQLRIEFNLAVTLSAVTQTLTHTLLADKGEFNGTAWVDGPYTNIRQAAQTMPGWLNATESGNRPFFSAGLARNGTVRERVNLPDEPLRWRMPAFAHVISAPFLSIPADAEGIGTSDQIAGSSVAAEGVFFHIEGTDPITGDHFERNVQLYQPILSTATWAGSITATPAQWFAWGEPGMPLYRTSDGTLISGPPAS